MKEVRHLLKRKQERYADTLHMEQERYAGAVVERVRGVQLFTFDLLDKKDTEVNTIEGTGVSLKSLPDQEEHGGKCGV